MRLATMFKGMLLSQGYVATLRALREVAPETLPGADVACETCAADAGAARAGDARPAPEAADEVDVAGAMPWQLAYAPRRRPADARTRAPASVRGATGANARSGTRARTVGACATGACCA